MTMIREGLTFDDVLLVPQYSSVDSRSKIDISTALAHLKFSHPIIPANMKTVIGNELASKIIESGGLAILHRFMPIEEQVGISEDLIDHYGNSNVSVSIGVKEEDKNNLSKFDSVGAKIVCIDIAHGASDHCVRMIRWIKENYPHMIIIAGNIATGGAAEALWRAGAHVVKVGVGPGSLCTTRIETGNGVPQLTALMDVANTRNKLLPKLQRPLHVIADGGIKNAGDVVKALCFSDMVMIGNLFAGCDEAPGNIVNIGGKSYKEYVGSSTYKTNHIEGVAAMVPYKGPFNNILTKLLEGLRSGCSYQSAHNLQELRDNPEFVRISSAGLKESHPHDVFNIK